MRSSMPNTTSSNISCRHSSPPWIPAWTTTTLKTIPPGRAKASRFLLKEPPIIADRAMAAYRRNSTDRSRQGFGRRAKEAMDEILDAEYKVVEHQIAPPLDPSLDPSMENNNLKNHSLGARKNEPVPAEGSTDNSGESNGSVSAQ